MKWYDIPASAAERAVTEDSPAQQAGLWQGDVITAVDGEAMTSTELVNFVGQQIIFSVYRQGETLEITVDVGEQIQSVLGQEQQQIQQSYPGNLPWGEPQLQSGYCISYHGIDTTAFAENFRFTLIKG